jgi:hypothetical protein
LVSFLIAQRPGSSLADETPKREAPDYDGRPEPTTAGDVLLWIPRIILSPLYLVSEFVVRRPLGFLVSEAERAQLPQALYDIFLFGPDHGAGILPIAFLDFGFEPSVGLFFFWNDAFVKHHDLKLRGATWGPEWLAGSISNTIHLSETASIGLHLTAVRRPDLLYFGTGPSSVQRDRSRYGSTRVEAGLDGGLAAVRLVRLEGGVGVRSLDFRRGDFDHKPVIEDRVAEGRFATPAGYETGYSVLYNRLLLAIDSRGKAPPSLSGVRFELSAEQMSDVRRAPGAGYLRYGAQLGGYYDLNDRGRVVSLQFGAQFADPLGERDVPFTELVTLSGTGPMRGFLPGRLVGRSGAYATLRYRWPIWVWLDGSIQLSTGNVFDEHLRDFKPGLLRFSGAIGLESGAPDSSFELLFGLGSETFDHGGEISSVRLVFGTNHGF